MQIYTCENTLEGIFSAIFCAYADRHPHSDNKIITGSIENYELFANYIPVETNRDHALRVSRCLYNTFRYEVFHDLCAALLCETSIAAGVADAVYHTIVLGLSQARQGRDARKILNHLTNPYVEQVFSCARQTNHEAHQFYGFLRFRELQNGVLLARFHPNNNIITLLIEHFDNRLPTEPYIIYDEKRDIAALHHPHHSSILLRHPEFAQEALCNYSKDEQQYETLWLQFYDSITIEARRNPTLQQSNIPKRFWKDTVELHRQK